MELEVFEATRASLAHADVESIRRIVLDRISSSAHVIKNVRVQITRNAESGDMHCLMGVHLYGGTLSYFDAYRSKDMPQNLTQAQRDYFGAHTYERVDNPGKAIHTDWAKA